MRIVNTLIDIDLFFNTGKWNSIKIEMHGLRATCVFNIPKKNENILYDMLILYKFIANHV